MVQLAATDLVLQIDFERNDPGGILQRLEVDGWQDYKPRGKLIRNPIDIESLPPGQYQLKSAK